MLSFGFHGADNHAGGKKLSAECFGEQAIAVSAGLSRELRRISKLMRCDFFDATPFAEVSPLDAVHMTERGHLRLGEAMALKIRQEIG